VWELDQLSDAIDRLRRLNAYLGRSADQDEKRILSERQRVSRLAVMAAFQSVRIAAEAGDGEAKEFLADLQHSPGRTPTEIAAGAGDRTRSSRGRH
jgi:hypothetical protein